MLDREKVVSKLDDLRQFADTEIHPIVSPDNWDVYSKLCDLIDMTKDDVLALLKEQDSMIEDARSQGWSEWYDECEREYQENM